MGGFAGFDIPEIRRFNSDLDALAGHAGGMHTDLAMLLTGVQQDLKGQPASHNADLQNLVGDVVPMPFFGRSRMPGALTGDLGDMHSSIKRRVAQLEGMEKLQGGGYPVDNSMLFLDEPAPDQKKIDKAVADLHDLNGKDTGFNGNRDDLEDLTKEMNGLTGAELDAVISKSSPEDLANYNKLLSNTDGGLFSDNGLPEDERKAALQKMLAKVGPENLPKFMKAFPELQPDFTNSEAYKNGGNNQNGQTNNGMGWATPTDPLIKDGISADDVRQNQFGDCWYMASLAAMAQKNPKALEEGIHKNANGTVSVRVWDKSGNYHWVTMTPDLPADQNGNIISATGNGDTWPAYYEKAFALSYKDEDGNGGYGGIEGDDPKSADPYLTGHEGRDEKSGGFLGMGKHDDMDIQNLKKDYEDGRAVTVSTPDDDSLEKNLPDHMKKSYCTNHAYYVRGFTDDGRIILGNPWGGDYKPMTVTQDEFEKYFQGPESYDAGK